MAKEKEMVTEVYEARFVMECAPEDAPRMRRWLISKIKFAAEASQRGPVIAVVYHNGHEVGRNETGTPSQRLKELADDDDEEPVVALREAR